MHIGLHLWSACGYSAQATHKQGKTATHTLIPIPCLIVTLISALHHRCNYTHSFLLTCWGLPPPPAGDGISCSVGMIIVGISNKKSCRVIVGSAHTSAAFLRAWVFTCVLQTVPSLTCHFHFFFQQSTFTSWVSNTDLLRTEEICCMLIEHSCEMTLSDDMWQKKNVFSPLALGRSKMHGSGCSKFGQILFQCSNCTRGHWTETAFAEVSILH